MSLETTGGEVYPKLQLTSQRTLRLLASAAAFWGAAVLIWAQKGLDKAVQIAHNPLREVPFLTRTAGALSTYGMAFCILVYLIFLALSFRFDGLKDLRIIFPLVILSFALAGIAGDVSKGAFGRPRPFVRYATEITPLIRPVSTSMPSGHTTKAFALTLPFILFAAGKKKSRTWVKVFFLFSASAIAYSRIVLGVHDLSDILAGIGTALLFLPIAAAAANAIYRERRLTEARLERLAAACGLVMLGLIYYLIHYS